MPGQKLKCQAFFSVCKKRKGKGRKEKGKPNLIESDKIQRNENENALLLGNEDERKEVC